MSVSAINAKPVISKNTSFGCENCKCESCASPVSYGPPKDSFVKRAATNLVAGAAVSGVFDIARNVIFKTGIPAKAIAINAAFLGGAFVVIDAVFNTVGKLFGSRR